MLVAEDNESARTGLVRLLERDGYEVTAANDGQAAMDILLSPNPPQIALLDWEMPHLDGIHVCCAVRSMPSNPYTYIIMVSARAQAADALAAFAAGVDDFLSKPMDSLQLLARLRCGERVLGLETHCAERIVELKKALHEVRKLTALLPICMYCKKVRNDSGYWQEIDAYIHDKTGTDFPHGICPSCMESVLNRDLPADAVERAERKSG